MQRALLTIGVVLLPFYEIIMKLLPTESIKFIDSRAHKAELSLLLMLPYICVTLFKDGIKPLREIWIPLLWVSFWASAIFGTTIMLPVGELNIEANWNFIPIAYGGVFLMFLLSVYSSDVDEDYLRVLMSWVGVVMSVYVMLQSAGLDQFQKINPADVNYGFVTQAASGGNLGQPTLVAPLLAMLAPIAWVVDKRMALVIAAGVICTFSDVAIGALLVGVLFYFMSKSKRLLLVFIGIMIAISTMAFVNKDFIESRSSGRFGQWGHILKDYRKPIYEGMENLYPFTGKGIGNFKYIFSNKYSSRFHEAHSEPLEMLWGAGLFGLFCYIMVHINVFFTEEIIYEDRSWLASFLILSICATGTFVYHLAVYGYFGCITLSMIYKRRY